MPEADDIIAIIAEIGQLGLKVVANGAAGITEANQAVQFLRMAHEKLLGSRVYAQQELEELKGLIDKTTALSQGSSNMDVMIALANFERSRQFIEDYASRITFSIDKLVTLINVIEQNRIEAEFDKSARPIEEGFIHLTTYRDSL